MKLQIEVELQGPEEINLATELLTTLRTFTEHVNVRRSGAAAQDTKGRMTVAYPPTSAPAAGPPQAANQASFVPNHINQSGFANGTNGNPLQPQQQAAQPRPNPRPPQAMPVPQPPQPPQQPSGPPPSQQTFEALMSSLHSEEQVPAVAGEVQSLLQTAGSAAFPLFFDAFLVVTFRPQIMQGEGSVLPYMSLLGKLEEPFRNRARDLIIHKVLKHLTAKRPLDAQRTDFFAHAEAFAGLVLLEFVSIPGAVQTIITLLKKPENRCAAITMLGKTIELCYEQLITKAEPAALDALQKALGGCEPQYFEYDMQYINETMGWPTAT